MPKLEPTPGSRESSKEPNSRPTSSSSNLTDLASQIASFQNQIPAPMSSALYTVWSGSNDILNLLGSAQFQSQSTMTSQGQVQQSALNEANAVVQRKTLALFSNRVLTLPLEREAEEFNPII